MRVSRRQVCGCLAGLFPLLRAKTRLTAAQVPGPAAPMAPDQAITARAIDAATIGAMTVVGTPGEARFNPRGDGTYLVRIQGYAGRAARRWLSYDLPSDTSNAIAIVVTYNALHDRPRTFDLFVDDEWVADEYLPASRQAAFFDVHYGVPAGLATGKRALTIRFAGTEGNEVAAVFAVRTVRA